MSKKHFTALADHIRSEMRRGVPWPDAAVNSIADFCAAQNPAFNRERWIGYILGENGKNGGRKP